MYCLSTALTVQVFSRVRGNTGGIRRRVKEYIESLKRLIPSQKRCSAAAVVSTGVTFGPAGSQSTDIGGRTHTYPVAIFPPS